MKNSAPANIFFIVTTFDVFHVSMPSKFLRFDFRNSPSMSVIRDVSMPPSGALASISSSSMSSRLQPGLRFPAAAATRTEPFSPGWAASSSRIYSAACLQS